MALSVKDSLEKTIQTIARARDDDAFCEAIERVADAMTESLKAGGTIFFCGNGGSAADSQHLAAELVGRLNKERPGLSAIALTTDTSALTAIGNDYGYQAVFSRQVEALGKKGDILVAISTSGNSENVLHAVKAANDKDMITVSMTGESGGKVAEYCHHALKAPSHETPHIQECHITMGHLFCGLVEEALFPSN